MEVYLFLIVSSLYLYILKSTNLGKKFERISAFIIFLELYIISAIRVHVGTDYGIYLDLYKKIDKLTYDPKGMEFGYFYLNKFVKNIFGGEYAIFAVTSLIIIGLVYLTVKKFSVDPVLSLIIYMCVSYLTSLNIIRQSIAISIVFFSIRYIDSKVKWLIPLLIGVLFHKTMILVIPFFFLAKLNLKKKHYIFIGIIGIGLFLTYGRTLIFITEFIEGFDHYVGSNFVKEGANPIRTIITFTIFIFFLLDYKEIMKNKNMKFAFTMFLFGTMFSLFMVKGKIFARVVDYFDIFQILLIPYVINSIKKLNIFCLKKYILLITTIILAANFYYFYYSVKTNQSNVIPYKTYITDTYIQKNFRFWIYR